jgi:hypothetical protein
VLIIDTSEGLNFFGNALNDVDAAQAFLSTATQEQSAMLLLSAGYAGYSENVLRKVVEALVDADVQDENGGGYLFYLVDCIGDGLMQTGRSTVDPRDMRLLELAVSLGLISGIERAIDLADQYGLHEVSARLTQALTDGAPPLSGQNEIEKRA